MPARKISELTAAAAATGTELLEAVQSSANVKMTVEQVRAYVAGTSNIWTQSQGFNVAISLTSGQINFPATQVSSTGANVLDDYEEGTFTPGLTFGGNSVGMTFTAQAGGYQKIGNRVNGWARLTLSAKGTSTGQAIITGLPFTVASGVSIVCPCYVTVSAGLASQHVQPIILSNSTTILLRYLNANTAANFTDANFTDTTDIILTFIYQTTA